MKNTCTARILVGLLLANLLTVCAAANMQKTLISDVYVADFNSDDMQTCRPSDVPLNHSRAKEFFRRARQVDYKVIHDHYNVAPCYVEGTLKYRANVCEWEIRAGATGRITCAEKTQHFVCDNCDDLFREQ